MPADTLDTYEATIDPSSGVSIARAAPGGPPSDADRELILPHLADPSMAEEHELVTWRATVSTAAIDSYFTRMHESSLRTFEQNAKDGVAWMNSHRTGGFLQTAELPMGHSYDGRYVGASGAGAARVDERFYSFRGLAPNGDGSLTVDQLVENMRSGLATDVSIGFYGGTFICSIDGKNWFRDMSCAHWPGETYAKLDAKGNETGTTELAYLWVHDAVQAEASSVFDGATPGCMVLKSRALAADGQIRGELVDRLERRYRINLPRQARPHGGVTISRDREDTMSDQFDLHAALSSALRDAGVAVDATSGEALVLAVRSACDELATLRPSEQDLVTLRALADEGRQYRADLVTSALTEGRRALGDAFADASYRALLEHAPLETVKRMRADWRAIADKTFPGGRSTVSSDESVTPITARARQAPPSAYRA